MFGHVTEDVFESLVTDAVSLDDAEVRRQHLVALTVLCGPKLFVENVQHLDQRSEFIGSYNVAWFEIVVDQYCNYVSDLATGQSVCSIGIRHVCQRACDQCQTVVRVFHFCLVAPYI